MCQRPAAAQATTHAQCVPAAAMVRQPISWASGQKKPQWTQIGRIIRVCVPRPAGRQAVPSPFQDTASAKPWHTGKAYLGTRIIQTKGRTLLRQPQVRQCRFAALRGDHEGCRNGLRQAGRGKETRMADLTAGGQSGWVLGQVGAIGKDSAPWIPFVTAPARRSLSRVARACPPGIWPRPRR
jgi:hypothetical protein